MCGCVGGGGHSTVHEQYTGEPGDSVQVSNGVTKLGVKTNLCPKRSKRTQKIDGVRAPKEKQVMRTWHDYIGS